MNAAPPTASQSKGGHLATLTSIRFFAALWVVSFHFGVYGYWLPRGFAFLQAQGAQGVSLFFVLSGFILAYTYNARLALGAFKAKDFFLARLARVYPLYLAALALGIAQQLLIPAPEGNAVLLEHPSKSILMNLGLVQNWSIDARGAINGPGWSIACEAAFYLAFPLLAAVALKVRGRDLVGLAVGVGVIAVVSDLVSTNALLEAWMPPGTGGGYAEFGVVAHGSKYLPFARFDEFMLGIVTYRLLVDLNPRRALVGLLLAGEVAAITSLGVTRAVRGIYLPKSGVPIYVPAFIDQVLPFAFALVILTLAYAGGGRPRWLSHRWLVYGGKISFALYLVHIPVLYCAMGIARAASLPSGVWGPVSVVAMLAVAAAGYHFVEEPGRRWILGWSKRRVRDEGPIPAAP